MVGNFRSFLGSQLPAQVGGCGFKDLVTLFGFILVYRRLWHFENILDSSGESIKYRRPILKYPVNALKRTEIRIYIPMVHIRTS